MPKFLKGRENTKPMSLPKKTLAATLSFLSVFIFTKAEAGLYGFHHYNPYTKEERILNLEEVPTTIRNYRALMRDNLLMLIRYAKEQKKDFKIIAHEGQDLLTKSLWEYDREGYNRARRQPNAKDDSFLFHKNFRELEPERHTPAYEYLQLLDAIAINNLYCGKNKESTITQNHNLGLITIEQCPTKDAVDEALVSAMIDHKITYGFTDLDNAFSTIKNHNDLNDSSKNVYEVSDAQNILILTDDSRYTDKNQLVENLLKTNYDIIVIKPLFANKERFSAEDIQRLRFKHNGSKRLLIAELNIAEASPQDYFWQNDWQIGNPSWLARKSFVSPDSFIVKFWTPEWRQIISRYFKDVVHEGFDGVFLTGIENFRYFEQQNPLE